MVTIAITDLDALVFDFDGVLTDNHVYVDAKGLESVRCSRADGLAFDALRTLSIRTVIISTETNPVVMQRAGKLQVPVMGGVADKLAVLQDYVREHGLDLSRVLYVGNDLNDLPAMKACGFSVCPADSHNNVKESASIVLQTRGGEGVVRELLEEVMGLDIGRILYVEQR